MKDNFIETTLKTKFGKFIIRVYDEEIGKETIVLRTLNINKNFPVIVRVHCECLTGELFKSLHCDCGNQLSESLDFINKNGGVLIYLRQEGRGIGLFEKMKAYELQSKGYDTFEANVKLGHDPDSRTYEKVKIILDNLQIYEIKLLTNNPTKVSEIAKFGINVVERIPLIMKSNKINKRYLEIKKNKFQHLLNSEEGHYYYQFHIDSIAQIKEIAEFLKSKKNDPLLKICAGINANHNTLSNKLDVNHIESLYNACEANFLTPILHFSFLEVSDIKRELEVIKKIIPCIKRMQLNDLKKNDLIENIEHILKVYPSIDIPLDDKTFKLINNKYFRKQIKDSNVLILLDNSKGRGIKEDINSLMKKINVLLDYGINNIAILGGFGPNELDSYFKLRRYYKINFSIDAETKLKTNGKIDIDKIKLYLFQLIRFDDPKPNRITQTRKFLDTYRHSSWEYTVINDKKFMIHPSVFHAGYFPSSAWFAKKICELVKKDKNFCEIGCGSGVISCTIALSNPEINIIATDINPNASQNTFLNAQKHGVEKQIEVKTGDVLDSVSIDTKFDSIFWALPFGFLDPGTNLSLEELQVFDPGYKSIRKFFSTAKKHLKQNGKIYIGFSSDLGHCDLLYAIADENNLKLKKISEIELKETEKIRFEILIGSYDK